MSPLPVFRIQKLKKRGSRTPAAVMGHLTRARVTPNADGGRTPHNRWLVGDETMSLKIEVERRLAKAGIKPRKDATIGVDFLLTASLSFFRDGEGPVAYGAYDPVLLEGFVTAAMEFVRQAFGDRVICAVLHLDEASAHVQGVMVPLLPAPGREGLRLSAKEAFNRTALRRMQAAWQALLEPLGCGRRLVGSTSHHVTNKQYHSSVAEVASQVDDLEWTMEPFPVFGRDPGEKLRAERDYHERQVARIKEARVPLAKAAVYGRMYGPERRHRKRLEALLDRAKARLVDAAREIEEAHREIGRRLDTRVPREELSVMLGVSFDDGPVLDQVSRLEGLSLGKASEHIAVLFGAEAALAMLVESMRPRLEGIIASRAATVDVNDADGQGTMSP